LNFKANFKGALSASGGWHRTLAYDCMSGLINIRDHSAHIAHGQTRCSKSRSPGTATSPARHKGDKIRTAAQI